MLVTHRAEPVFSYLRYTKVINSQISTLGPTNHKDVKIVKMMLVVDNFGLIKSTG